MNPTTPRPPPLPAKHSRNLIWLIVGSVLVVSLAMCGGFFGCLWWLFTGIASSGTFSMDDYRCEKNRDEIALLKEEWVTVHEGKNGDMIPAADLAQMLAESEGKLVCPLDPQKSVATSYEISPIGADPKCKCQALHEQKHEEQKKK